ncbi:PadR family transcriptional regulator [Acholeplasma granularum]|uniref:PadR family transcriptional regulator n=1 Tax=Acholeplasma granularum TaxID=264635 RepID=UPI0004B609DD|nr:PadR family transcriptional regulator [Acholeplasma granularum]
MSVDLKKYMIELFVLALLTKGPSYGYKLVSDLNNYIQMSESTLYPVLRRLEKDNRLSTYNEIYGGRNRKYYKITESGRKYIDSYIEEWKDIKKIYDIILEGK